MDAELKILLCGRSGVGKSSLCNSLFGRKLCKEGHPGAADGLGLQRCTEKTTKYVVTVNGIEVSIFDSPGLQDGTGNDEWYVDDMYSKCKDVDLVLYCLEMTAARFTQEEMKAITLITSKFGSSFWKRCVVVLTKANCVVMPRNIKKGTPHEKIDYHRNIFKAFRKNFCDQLIKEGVAKEIRDSLSMVAAGLSDLDLNCAEDDESDRFILFAHENKQADPGPPLKLIDFIAELWVICLETIPDKSRVFYLLTTALGGRITENGEQTGEMKNLIQVVAKDLSQSVHDAASVTIVNRFDLDSSQVSRATRSLWETGALVGAYTACGISALHYGAQGAELGAEFGRLTGSPLLTITGGLLGGLVGAAAGMAIAKDSGILQAGAVVGAGVGLGAEYLMSSSTTDENKKKDKDA